MSEKENDDVSEGETNTANCQSTLDLQMCLKSIVEKVLQNVSDEKFIQIYKNCYGQFEKKSDIEKPALSGSSVEARKYHTQFNSMVTKAINGAIDDTVLSMNMDLTKLEELKKEQSKNTVTWRPPGDAKLHMMPFEYLCEVAKKKELENRIKKEQEALDFLKARLLQKRSQAQEHHELIMSSVANIKHIVCRKDDCQTINE